MVITEGLADRKAVTLQKYTDPRAIVKVQDASSSTTTAGFILQRVHEQGIKNTIQE